MTKNSEHEKSAASGGGNTVTLTVEEWQAWRKAAGLHIDPETAVVFWEYTQVGDPYGV